MGFKDDLVKRRDGSYVLRHKTKKSKKGDCKECGQNSKTRMLAFRYNTEDMLLIRQYIEEHLRTNFTHESMAPNWCSKCQALLDYKIKIDFKKVYRRDNRAYSKALAEEEKNETRSYV